MNKVKRATLLSIQQEIYEENVNPTHKAVVLTENGEEVILYCKALAPRELFVECAIALIGRDLGISIPKPYIVLATPESNYPNIEHPISEPILLFGSESIDYPNLFRKLEEGIDKSFILPALSKCDDDYGIVLFDEWIANTDRHFGNILFDGGDKFFFIDHDCAVPSHCQCEVIIGKNKLLNSLIPNFPTEEKKQQYLDNCMLKHAPKCANYTLNDISERTFAQTYLDGEEINYLENFLQKRVTYISNFLHQRLNIKQQELFGAIH